MRKLTATLCLTAAVLLGSAGMSWSADFQTGLDAYNRVDYITALQEWTPLAEQGDADAQYNLGLMYDKGDGVPQDYKTTVKWYTLAAEQGHAPAQTSLGLMYHNGYGVVKDFVRAYMWYNLATSQGEKDATENRDIVAKKMTSADVSKAKDLARECVKKNYKGC